MNLLDLMKTLGPDGSVIQVAQTLDEMNDGILSHVNFIEGNMETGHQHAQQTSLPSVSLGAVNKGVVSRKGTTAQVTDTVSRLESLSEVASNMLERSPNPALSRMQYDLPHVESMHQRFFYNLWYGQVADNPLLYNGLTFRYSDPTENNGDNIIDGSGGVSTAGRTDLQSIWIIKWGPMTVTGIIPKRSVPGLQRQDWGEYLLEDDGSGTNARIKVYGTYFRWDAGIAIPDWRYAVRICNIPVTAVQEDAATGPNLPSLIKEAVERLPGSEGANIYLTRQMRAKLGQQLSAGVDSSTLTMENVGGVSSRRVMVFDETPIWRTDSLVPRTAAPPDGVKSGETAVAF